jgi:hypothetical protein
MKASNTCVLSALLVGLFANVVVAQRLDHYDDYGPIYWKDEKARLDNFAIQLLNDKSVTGYIFIVAAFDQCPGEAQARAIRAKRYVVEHGKVPWNRVIWRFEGYSSDVSTVVLPLPRDVSPPFPFRYVSSGKDGPLTKECKIRLRQIAKSLRGLPPKASHR